MNRLFLIAILSFVVPFLIFFNSSSLTGIITVTIIFGVFIFGILWLLWKAHNQTSRRPIFVMSAVILALFLFLFAIALKSGGCALAITAPTFKTNILTGECIFQGENFCNPTPWYYEADCPTEKKLDPFKRSYAYDYIVSTMKEKCISLCNSGNKQEFCNSENISFGYRGVGCFLVTDCNSIQC